MDKELTHLDEAGTARMVDVGHKPVSKRTAIAQTVVRLAPATLKLLLERNLPKGDALACARIGAVLAAKRTPEIVPLCHSLPLSHVDIDFEIDEKESFIRILARTACSGQTGVEMEAIVAAQTAGAILYDMCKAVQRDIVITDTKLLFKAGGKSGEYRAPDFNRVSGESA